MFVCTKCDAQFPKWQGRCGECQNWGTIQQLHQSTTTKQAQGEAFAPEQLLTMDQVAIDTLQRISSGVGEFDKVCGGGIVPGSLLLLGGAPGIGKSTLVLQIAAQWLAGDQSVIYFSGEETSAQLKGRANRLALQLDKLQIATTTDIDRVLATIRKQKPALVILDSIQVMHTSLVEGGPGGVAQVRSIAAQLLELVKTTSITVLMIGHITKDGTLAGPKTLEHMVDVVVTIEGERLSATRLIRSVKNRFGPTGEVGIIDMTKHGFVPASDTSELFHSVSKSVIGTAIGAIVEGSRVFLVDVHALVTRSVSNYPQRVATGTTTSRIQTLLAIIQNHTGASITGCDTYVQIPGNWRQHVVGLDLAVCMALLSSYYQKPLPDKLVCLGEVSLSGYIRPFAHSATVATHARSIGVQSVLLPQTRKKMTSSIIDIHAITTLTDAVAFCFPDAKK